MFILLISVAATTLLRLVLAQRLYATRLKRASTAMSAATLVRWLPAIMFAVRPKQQAIREILASPTA